jgi:hypothetical protein
MSSTFMRGVAHHLPKARITFDSSRSLHASAVLDETRRPDSRAIPASTGRRWTLIKGRQQAVPEARADLYDLIRLDPLHLVNDVLRSP